MRFQIPVPDKKITNPKYQKIIDAAIKVFAQKGFYNAKVNDVSKAADVADGTIYLYFKNKDDLLISIFEHSMDYFFQKAKEAIEPLTCPKEQLKKFAELHLKLVEENQNLAIVLQVELRSSHKFMTEYRADKFFQYLKVLEDIIQVGQDKGVFRPEVSSSLVARIFFGAIDEAALEWILTKNKKYTLKDASNQIFDVFAKGLLSS